VHRQTPKEGERQQKRRASGQTERVDTLEQGLTLEGQVPQFAIRQE